jgi:hypothetical protein
MADDAALAPGPSKGGPIILLTCAHTGAEVLRDVLARDPALACTSGTGIVPLCRTALATWRSIDGRGTARSALAIRSVRALATTMITAVQAAGGGSRWCELALATPESAAAFLEIFPDTTFICVYRALPGVLAEGLTSYPWGLGGSPFWPYAGSHPGNNVATIANYWVANIQGLLEFEANYFQHCARVRYEDLAADQKSAVSAVFSFLGLDAGLLAASHRTAATPTDKSNNPESPAITGGLPAGLSRTINDLSGRLGYPAPCGESTGTTSISEKPAAAGISERTAAAGRADTVGNA